jgi:hypothetical protein
LNPGEIVNPPTRSSSGRYHYLLNGEDTGVEETWLIEDRGGQRRIESTREARPVGIRIRVESSQLAGRFDHCHIEWQQELNGARLAFSADYHFDGDQLRVTRRSNGESTQHQLSAEGVFSPLMRIYNGGVIRQLLASGGSARVLVPWIQDHRQPDRLLLPDYSQRSAEPAGQDSLLIDGRRVSCRKFHYSGGEYAAGTPFWLDERDVMLMYRWQRDRKTLWEVSLRDYRPAP